MAPAAPPIGHAATAGNDPTMRALLLDCTFEAGPDPSALP
jgi:hypothetical protein